MAEDRRILTPEFRLSFPKLFKADKYEDGDPKFSMAMVFYPDAVATPAYAAMKAAAKESIEYKWPDAVKRPKELKNPFRKPDSYKEGMYPDDTIIVKASTSEDQPPGLFYHYKDPATGKAVPIKDIRDLYAGCWCQAVVVAFAYDRKGNRGVSFILKGVQKLRDGEAFGSGGSSADKFNYAAAEAALADDVDPFA
jgi:hypothetical protein